MKKIPYVILGFISVLILYGTHSDIGSLADWLSSIANIFMAFVAYKGFLIAKNWKRDATQELAIEHSSNILSTHLPNTQKQFTITILENTFNRWLCCLIDTKSVRFTQVKVMHGLIKSFDSIIGLSSKNYRDLISEYSKLKILGWSVKPHKKDSFSKILKQFEQINSKQTELITLLTIIMGYWGITINDNEVKEFEDLTWNLTDNPHVSIAYDLSSEIIRLKEDLHNEFENLNINDSSIFDIFESNK